MNAVIKYEMEHGRRLTLRDWSQQKWGRKLLARLAWSLRWWL